METEKLSQDIVDSVITQDETLDLISDLTELSFKQIIDGPLNEIPVIKTITGITKFGISIRDNFLIKKILLFLQESHKLNQTDKERFKKKVKSDRKYTKRVGEHLILILDRFDHLNKAVILAKLLIAFLENKLSEQEFFRLSSSVENAFLNDLENIAVYYKNNLEEVNQTILQNLYRCGFVSLLFNNITRSGTKLVSDDSRLPDIQSAVYVRNELGLLFCKLTLNYDKDAKIIVSSLNDLENKVFESICKQEDINKDHFNFEEYLEELKVKFKINDQLLNFMIANFNKLGLIQNVGQIATGNYYSFQTSFIGYNFYFQKLKGRNEFFKMIIDSLIKNTLKESNSFSLDNDISQRRVDHCLLLLQNKGLVYLGEHSTGYFVNKIQEDELKKYERIL